MTFAQTRRPRLAALIVAVVACATMLSGCGDAAKRSPESTPAPPKRCTVDECPELAAPAGRIGPSGVTPQDAATAVPAYLKTVLDDLDEVWQGWFTQLNIANASTGRELIGPGQEFTSACHDADGATVTMDSDYPNAMFCGLDVRPDGQGQERTGSVILPEQTFAEIWDGRLMGQKGFLLGDFTAATIVAHEYGHNVMFRLATAYDSTDGELPAGNDPELLADCFAGNWASTVFARKDLSAKEIAQAAALMVSVADPAPGMGHGTIPERVAALSRGFGLTGDGRPLTCLKKYWPQALGPQAGSATS